MKQLFKDTDRTGVAVASSKSSLSLNWYLRSAVEVLNHANLDGDELLADAGIFVSQYDNGRRVPTSLIARAWKVVTTNINDPAIGIRAAYRHFNPADWQSLGLAILCSGSIRQALERTVRFYTIVSDWASIKLEEDWDRLSIIVSVPEKPREIAFEAMEFGLAALLVLLQEIFPRPLQPMQIELLRPRRLASEEFAKLFGCPVVFESDREALSFNIAVANEVLPASNEMLARYQDLLSEHYVDNFGKGSTTRAVSREIMRLMPGRGARLAEVASRLNMSSRQLQRRMANEQTSFETLLKDIRMDLCSSFIKSGQHTLIELSFLLGFSSQSNFSRAFKQWFDISPSEFKKQL